MTIEFNGRNPPKCCGVTMQKKEYSAWCPLCFQEVSIRDLNMHAHAMEQDAKNRRARAMLDAANVAPACSSIT